MQSMRYILPERCSSKELGNARMILETGVSAFCAKQLEKAVLLRGYGIILLRLKIHTALITADISVLWILLRKTGSNEREKDKVLPTF